MKSTSMALSEEKYKNSQQKQMVTYMTACRMAIASIFKDRKLILFYRIQSD
jgi:lipopolysaccharide biosynthesis glycosyltransferase